MTNRPTLAVYLAATLATSVAGAAFAQPADPNYQAQQQDYQAKQQQYRDQQAQYQQKQDAYAQQKANYRDKQDQYAEQRRVYALGRAQYEAKYGVGSYDVFTRSHTTTTTTVSPAGDVESRSKTTVIEHSPGN